MRLFIMITTYIEDAAMVQECVLRLLCAPEPAYMEKYIYVCDDGHSKPDGPAKKAVVNAFRALGMCLQKLAGSAAAVVAMCLPATTMMCSAMHIAACAPECTACKHCCGHGGIAHT